MKTVKTQSREREGRKKILESVCVRERNEEEATACSSKMLMITIANLL